MSGQELERLEDDIADLLDVDVPVTFLDVVSVAERARGFVWLNDSTLAALVELHDAQHTTDGARTILAELLTSLVRRAEEERARGARTLRLIDSGKWARTRVGQTVTVALEGRRGGKGGWQLERVDGPATTEEQPRTSGDGFTTFSVRLDEVSTALVTFTETGLGPNDNPRRMELRLIAEPRAP